MRSAAAAILNIIIKWRGSADDIFPDASFPVINIEKGRFPGHVTASFEVSTENARILSIEAGIKINVVPGKAHATITGLTEEEVRPMGRGCDEGDWRTV